MLDHAERDAVLGDLEEQGIGGIRAIWAVLGLVARRQATGLPMALGIALPGGLLLGSVSSSVSQRLAVHLWTYWNHGVRFETGLTAGQDAFVLICNLVSLLWWAWTVGFALGHAARRTVVLNASALCLAGLSSGGVLILLPAAWGARLGSRRLPIRGTTAIAMASLTVALAVLAHWTRGWWDAAYLAWSRQL